MKRSLYIVVIALLAIDFGQSAQAAENGALELEAAVKAMKSDYRGAEEIYSKVLSEDSGNINAWLQRALVRREQKNLQGAHNDALQAQKLIDLALQKQPKRPGDLYYDRSTADRILGDFDAAERDLNQAIQLGKRGNFDNDFKAIAVERKMAQ